MLENTEAFKSFEGTESFLKLLMKYNCTEPIGLKILLCFGHFKQLFDSKLHLWNIVKPWWKRLFCKMLKVKVTLMSLHRWELDNQYVLFQMTLHGKNFWEFALLLEWEIKVFPGKIPFPLHFLEHLKIPGRYPANCGSNLLLPESEIQRQNNSS